jgi:hypothetical protein
MRALRIVALLAASRRHLVDKVEIEVRHPHEARKGILARRRQASEDGLPTRSIEIQDYYKDRQQKECWGRPMRWESFLPWLRVRR